MSVVCNTIWTVTSRTMECVSILLQICHSSITIWMFFFRWQQFSYKIYVMNCCVNIYFWIDNFDFEIAAWQIIKTAKKCYIFPVAVVVSHLIKIHVKVIIHVCVRCWQELIDFIIDIRFVQMRYLAFLTVSFHER